MMSSLQGHFRAITIGACLASDEADDSNSGGAATEVDAESSSGGAGPSSSGRDVGDGPTVTKAAVSTDYGQIAPFDTCMCVSSPWPWAMQKSNALEREELNVMIDRIYDNYPRLQFVCKGAAERVAGCSTRGPDNSEHCDEGARNTVRSRSPRRRTDDLRQWMCGNPMAVATTPLA